MEEQPKPPQETPLTDQDLNQITGGSTTQQPIAAATQKGFTGGVRVAAGDVNGDN